MSSTVFAPPTIDDDSLGAPDSGLGVDGVPPGAADPATPADGRSFVRRFVHGPVDDPAWARPGLLALLVITGVLYIWGLGASGWANSFYSAAVQAGTKSWKAFFFGSSDASNFITVDKPPASLWAMEISARLFGVNSWSILVPQALQGVAVVGLMYAMIRRWFGAGAGLIAGAVMALTPVAVLMFRFNNPDAMLVLVLVGAAYAMTRALEQGRTKWLVAVGVLIGFGFLAKMLQAFVIVPGFAVTYLIAAPPRFRKRLWQLLVAGIVMFASAGWWVAIVELAPKSWRPYVGGSTNNSVLNLIFGYNGLGRLSGNETGSVGGGASRNGAGMWGPTGWLRMFNSQFGGQTSWLIPAALILGAAGLVVTIRRPRVDRSRAALLLWGSWLVVTAVLLSLSKGIIHPYYTVALAPAIGALIGIGAHLMWKRRSESKVTAMATRSVLAAAVLVSAWWGFILLDRSVNWHSWLRTFVPVVGIIAAVALLAGPWLKDRLGKVIAVVAVAASLVAGLAGPAAYALQTASTAHTGSIPSAGPAGASGRGSFAGFGGGNQFGGNRNGGANRTGGTRAQTGQIPGAGEFPGAGQFPGGQQPQIPGASLAGGTTAGGTIPRIPGGGIGGLLEASKPSAALVALLEAHAGNYKWVMATIGANQASGYQLATGDPVMAIGGFNGTDPTPTLAAFQGFVAKGQIHYYIAGGTGDRSSSASAITAWVEQHFTAATVGSTTLYDFTQAVK